MKRALACAAIVALLAPSAAAHLVSTGVGPFYDGLAHVALTPEDLLPVIALALYAGLGGVECGRRALLVLPLAWLGGGVLGLIAPISAWHPGVFALSALIAGALLAADVRRTPRSVAAIAATFGLIHGHAGGSGADGPSQGFVTVLGCAAAVFVLTALGAALASQVERPWKRVAVRVAGSWIAAIGLLVGAWALR